MTPPPRARSDGQRGAGDVERGEEVLVEDGLQIGRVHVVERLGAGAADVVDDDVDAAELLDGRLDDRRRALRGRDVRDDADRPPRPCDRAHRRVELVAAAGAEDDVAPSSARRVAMPRPMPRLEPVTSATLPVSPRSTQGS